MHGFGSPQWLQNAVTVGDIFPGLTGSLFKSSILGAALSIGSPLQQKGNVLFLRVWCLGMNKKHPNTLNDLQPEITWIDVAFHDFPTWSWWQRGRTAGQSNGGSGHDITRDLRQQTLLVDTRATSIEFDGETSIVPTVPSFAACISSQTSYLHGMVWGRQQEADLFVFKFPGFHCSIFKSDPLKPLF